MVKSMVWVQLIPSSQPLKSDMPTWNRIDRSSVGFVGEVAGRRRYSDEHRQMHAIAHEGIGRCDRAAIDPTGGHCFFRLVCIIVFEISTVNLVF